MTGGGGPSPADWFLQKPKKYAAVASRNFVPLLAIVAFDLNSIAKGSDF